MALNIDLRERGLRYRIRRHDGARHLLQVDGGATERGMERGQGGNELLLRQRNADDAGGRRKDRIRTAAKDLSGFGANLLRGENTRFAGCAICIASIDHDGAHAMFAALQVTFSDRERRCNDPVAGEHGGSGGGLVQNGAGEVGMAARLDAGSHGGEAES